MELNEAAWPNLAQIFVEVSVMATHAESICELLPFYQCYREYVRGKVLSFQLDEPEVPEQQCTKAGQKARALFALAACYAQSPKGQE